MRQNGLHNMTHPTKLDVIVVGAGPAGITAALRLTQLGYQVLLIERSSIWPRSHIGEALTAGVRNIIDMLDANDAMENVPHITSLATRIRWRNIVPEMVQHGDAAVVQRADFDAALLRLAEQRGVHVVRPASVEKIEGAAFDWQITYRHEEHRYQVHARFILDAKGRNQHQKHQYACAPRLSAMWAEMATQHVPTSIATHTQVEALEHGWCWGTVLPNGQYRIMWVGDPQTAHQQMPGQAEAWLRANCQASVLFQDLAHLPFTSELQVCVATPYLSLDSWQEGCLKLGDAAFFLDPISSSGVEKAMRFSLQTVAVVHTLLSGSADRAALAQDFYQCRLIETCARHSFWAQSYYRQAWCIDRPFWKAHAAPITPNEATPNQHPLITALLSEISALEDHANQSKQAIHPMTRFNPESFLRFCDDVRLQTEPCIIDDMIQAQLALHHPKLPRPIAFVENEALFPRLHLLQQSQTLHQVLTHLSNDISIAKAQKIITWLWQRGVVESVEDA